MPKPSLQVLGPPTNRGSSTGGKSGEGGTWHQQQQQQRGRRRGDDAEIPGYIVEDSIGGIRGAGSAHLGRAQSQTRNGDSSLNFATSTEQHRQHRQQQQKLASKAAPGSAGIQGRSSYLAESSLSASEAEQGRQRDEGRDSAPEIWEPRTKSKTTIAGGEASMGDDKDDGESAAGEVPDVAVLAVRESHLEALDLMVENGELEDVNGKDATGDTLLCIAVKPNRFKSVLWLCNNGADIHTRGRGGRLPLSIAQQLGHKGLEKFLSVWSNIALNSPLHLAALQGNLRGLQLALSTSQVMINSAEPFGHHTPLQLAVKQQHFECAELLIQRKANLDLQHPLSLETPLATAVLLHNDALVMLLIQGGATIKNHLNRPLAIWAVDRQCSERIVNIILACQRLQAGGDRGGGGDTSSDSDGLDGFKDVSDDEDEDASLNKAASTVSIRPRSVSPTKPTAPVPSTERLVPTDLFESLVSPVSLRPAQQPPPISRSPPSVISTCKACGTDVMSDMRRIKDQDGYFRETPPSLSKGSGLF